MLLNAADLLEVAFAFYISLSPLKSSFKDLAKQIRERSNKVCQDMPLVSLHLIRNFEQLAAKMFLFRIPTWQQFAYIVLFVFKQVLH